MGCGLKIFGLSGHKSVSSWLIFVSVFPTFLGERPLSLSLCVFWKRFFEWDMVPILKVCCKCWKERDKWLQAEFSGRERDLSPCLVTTILFLSFDEKRFLSPRSAVQFSPSKQLGIHSRFECGTYFMECLRVFKSKQENIVSELFLPKNWMTRIFVRWLYQRCPPFGS